MTTAQNYLASYIKKSRPYLDSFFERQQKLASLVSPIAGEMVKVYHNFMGGKNLRGALTYGSYHLFGGRAEADIIKASLMVEIIHSFGLIHDDIMDQDFLRRNQPTVHVQYERIFKKRYPSNTKKSPPHFGLSLALDVGDLGSYFSNLVLTETGFDPAIKLKFLKTLSQTIITTIFGQGLDVTFESDPTPSEAKVLQVHRLKSADYTISGPLKYGAVLAGREELSPQFKALDLYGTSVGIAFQLRDDELGMFSTQEKLGKPIDSDLKEGKNTLLFLKAFEWGSKSQVGFLKYAHGNRKVSQNDAAKVRKIVVESGALDYSQKESRRLVSRGKKYIPLITKNNYYRELLEAFADYVIERDS